MPSPLQPLLRRHLAPLACLSLLALSRFTGPGAAAAGPCGSSPIACENQKEGTPRSEWDVAGAGDPSIQGFATDISVSRGQTVHFKVQTDANAYQIGIYRLGDYGGLGARRVATITPSAPLPQSQPECGRDAATGRVDCGNWTESASWAVPADATTGVYIAKPTRVDTAGASHILFVVRDEAAHSEPF